MTTTYRREIVWDRETKDFAMYLNDELVGFARSYHEGEVTLDALVLELIQAETFVAARPAEVATPIAVHSCPDCGEAWDLHQCPVCGWTAKPLVLARPGEVAEVVYAEPTSQEPSGGAIDPVYSTGVFPLLTCEQCLATKIQADFATFLAAAPGAPIICDACLDTLPMDLVMALVEQNASPARPVAPQTSAIEDMTQASAAPVSPPSDRPDVAPYRCPECGDPVEAEAQRCNACREDAGVVDPTHCAHLEACDSSSCAACEPRWRGQTGRSMVGWLNDDLPAFLVFFASLSEPNKAETYAAIAAVSENTPGDVETFLSRSRARATALGML